MPFPFVIPTTSSFSFSPSFECDSHPSLPLNASTSRGIARDALKRHKRMDASSQAGNLSTVRRALNDYLPYLIAVDAGLNDRSLPSGQIVRVRPKAPFTIKWRPTLSGDIVPGRERSRVKISSLEHETCFMLSALGFSYVQEARTVLQPLYATSHEFVGAQERTTAISTATKLLLTSASIFKYAAARAERALVTAPCVDVAETTVGALASLAHAEATLLAVLKDDPYPAAVAQDRNKSDKEWMFKSPEIPKVRAHLYARLCLAASEHASRALSLAKASVVGSSKLDSGLIKYIEDFRRTSRAKACRFLGIDAELGGQTAEGIGWLEAGLQELGVDIKDFRKGSSASRFRKGLRKEWSELMEDRRVEKEKAWGADAGRLEETRVIELLDEKWNKFNDTMNTKAIPSVNSLLAKIPSGREIHSIPEYQPPSPDGHALEAMRGPPDPNDEFVHDMSSDDDMRSPSAPSVGAFPEMPDYGRSPTSASSNTYF
ncbi:pH-response regulator protein-like protein [Hapsidospora chrysogenum ATCC 11550]|uniref:pH-response regulator protein palC n=1 Tax=Hapsidospora chrysogenum (strain ATCC 11550 / CBS 779.69 / DSM 880 / IAM 14645 / JCM 23072 / IMI 49137) TaxID=857340 RepID=A0A086SV70_HAPC1|nr:pH-response regulator protein-like protein [Hapsidospora chrysogenum ATCC 11550]